ncbi:hypothetical protein GDO81_024895, partial [Engystomops pustulosus]
RSCPAHVQKRQRQETSHPAQLLCTPQLLHTYRTLTDMPVTEKDLAEDAPWKKIQQNTFTRWCNEHLKCVNKRIGNLQTDLSDGLRLIALLEVLSQKRMYRKYHQRPTFSQMQLENVSVALEFLEKENIKLVSIGYLYDLKDIYHQDKDCKPSTLT